MTERKIENEDNNKEEIEKQKKIEERKKVLAAKRKLEEANLTEEEKQKLKERRKIAMQKKLEGLSEEERKKLLEERKKRAKQRKIEEQQKLQEHQKLHEQQKDEISKELNKKINESDNSKEGEVSIQGIEEQIDMNKNTKNSKSRKVKATSKKINKKQEKLNAKKKKNEAKQQKNGAKSKMSKVAKAILVIILILLIVAGVIFGMRVKDNGGGMQGIVATVLGHDSSTLENLPELRFVLVGQSQNLTDTIMICSYNPRSQKASILSIPRDTYTGNNKSRATAYEKINVLYQEKPEKLVAKLNELTGLDIKYYVHVDTDGLVELVDAIGGVDFDVPINMDYDDSSQKLYIHLKAGNQHLNGDKAEQLVRFRHNNNGSTYPAEYGHEDIGRMRTQREFIKVVIKKMAKAENVSKIDDYITIANKYIKTNMDFNACKDYAPYALSFNSDNVRTETLPGTPEKCNGLWFYTCNKKETLALVADMFSLEPTEEDETEEKINEDTQETTKTDLSKVNVKGVKVEILNGTSNSKNLTNLKSELQKAGFTVSKTGTTSKTSKTTIINRTGKSNEIVEKLKSTVGTGATSTGSNNSGVDFTIVIGADF